MRKIKVVGLAGNRGVGKDTFYSLLNERNPVFARYAFADALKNDLSEFVYKNFGFSIGGCTPQQKEIIRPILIAYGCAQRAVSANYWVDKVCKQIKEEFEGNDAPDWIPVVTDVRFENEVEVLKKTFGEGFVLVDIGREGAPPPTDEEEKHFRQVSKMAEYHMFWGNDEKSLQLEFADAFLKVYFPK